MHRYQAFIAFSLTTLLSLFACNAAQNTPTPTPASGLPNPASVYCEQNGGKLEMRQDASGGTQGFCKFSDGSECDEWAYYRGQCKPGSDPSASQRRSVATSDPSAVATEELGADGWKVYRNSQLGYVLHYPTDAAITYADDPQRALTISGPQVNGNNSGNHWPTIFVNHPSDREDYRPPQGVDLEKWLKDHNLLMTGGPAGEVRLADTEIAGTRAIHTRLARSPQTYAYDKYYFANSQQLHSVVILHTGDKEDWDLYKHFLGSIRFER